MKKALIYSRVSTEEQAREGRHSLKTQRRFCRTTLEKMGYTLATKGIYEDAGKSGLTMSRSGLQDMLIRVQEDKSITSVFVQDTDRLARNAENHLSIKATLRNHGVSLVSASQPGIEDTPEGNFMDLIIAGVNQLQSQTTSRKTIKSLENKFKEGWWITRAPLGYLNVGEKSNENKRVIITDKVRAPLIAELFKLYATGHYSVFELRERLYKKGLAGYTGKKPSKSVIFRILGNPFYHGEMNWRGLKQIGKHKPIIDKSLFDRCQQVKAERNHYACRDRKYNFLFNGLIYSSTTGMRYTGEHHPKKNKSYYRCHGKGDSKPALEDKPIRMDKFEKYVEDAFVGIEFSKKFLEKVIKRVEEIYNERKKGVRKDKKKMTGQKVALLRKLEMAEEKLISGTLSDNAFTRIKVRLRERIDNVEEEISKLERSRNVQVDVIQDLLVLIRNIGEAYKKAPTELQRVYLGLFWDRFEVSERLLVSAVPSPIIKTLIASNGLNLITKQKPLPKKKVFANSNKRFRDNVQIRSTRGA